jgi:hypothetical protein
MIDSQSTGLDVSSTQDVIVGGGTTAHPQSLEAASPFPSGITVTTLDQLGDVATGYSGQIRLTMRDGSAVSLPPGDRRGMTFDARVAFPSEGHIFRTP